MDKTGYVYIIANNWNKVLYTGVTRDLAKRIGEHKHKMIKGFSRKYNCTKLVYFEDRGTISAAIFREKQIKGGSRKAKVNLIEAVNPGWRDLSADIGVS